MEQRLLSYALKAVPRYTSYPTAPHFSPAITAGDYGAWLEALDPARSLSLYLHVPFCKKLCWYCGCNMKLAARAEPVARYAETLRAEVELIAERLPARMRLSHIALGGGTPTALSPDDLTHLMDTVSIHFDIENGAERSIECDPRTLQKGMVRTIGALGFNRASFGVQEFDPTVQTAINRFQPPDLVRLATDRLRAAGVFGINFDLIYGLPHQTVASLTKTIALCAEMAPDRLAIFGYAHVPWMAKKQRMIDEAALPGAAERLTQAEAAAKAITEAGYVTVGLDHFALPSDPLAIAARKGTLARNFQGYTTDNAHALIGLGSSAIGRTPHGFVQNMAETGAWDRAVRDRTLPVARGYRFEGEDILRGSVIERLMCGASVDLRAAGERFGAPPGWSAGAIEELAELERDGLVSLSDGVLTVLAAGRPFVRVVAAAFDAHMARRQARHSLAV